MLGCADRITSSPCDVFASFTSFQDLSDDEGHQTGAIATTRCMSMQWTSERIASEDLCSWICETTHDPILMA